MKAVQMLGNRSLKVVEVSDPEPEDDWVVVKVKACALCGSDLNSFYRPPIEHAFANNRNIPGHEIAGVVVKSESPDAIVGQRVSVYPCVSCGECAFCRQGFWKACPSLTVVGFGLDGGHAEYVRVPSRVLLPLPDTVSDDTAALIWDGIGAPYGAIKRLKISDRDTVMVFGCGPIGLGAVNLCKYFGATVIAVDPISYRRDMASRIGADFVFGPQEIVLNEKFQRNAYGEHPDVCLECTGKEEVLHQALAFVKYGGRIGLIGELGVVSGLDFSREVIHRDLEIVGSFVYDHNGFDELLDLLKHGLDIEKLITHRFSITESEKAWSLFDQGETGKVLIYP